VPLCWLVNWVLHCALGRPVIRSGVKSRSGRWPIGFWPNLPAGCLLLADRLYGVGRFVNEYWWRQTVGSQWGCAGCGKNVKSAFAGVGRWQPPLVAGRCCTRGTPIHKAGMCSCARRGPGAAVRVGPGVTVRLWTSLLDASACPAADCWPCMRGAGTSK